MRKSAGDFRHMCGRTKAEWEVAEPHDNFYGGDWGRDRQVADPPLFAAIQNRGL